MQNRVEDARIGHVSMVQETHGLGEQQSWTVDAVKQPRLSNGPGLQEQPVAFGQQRCQPKSAKFAIRRDQYDGA
jgi:hypothetical protein